MLSRHKGETIVIGKDITITVFDIRGDKVRLGIEAPKHISVHRFEVAKAIARGEAKDATNSNQETSGDTGDSV